MFIFFKSEDFVDGVEVGKTSLHSENKPYVMRPFGSPDPTLVEEYGWISRAEAMEKARMNDATLVEL